MFQSKTFIFSLPVTASTTVFLSSKGPSIGQINIKVEDPKEDGRNTSSSQIETKSHEQQMELVQVEVLVSYTLDHLLNYVEVKQLERESEDGVTEVGVGILVSLFWFSN
jgi:hypothetical protein